MEEFVQLKLETYNELYKRSEELDSTVEEHLKYVDNVAQLLDKFDKNIIELHQYILEAELSSYLLKENTLRDVTNIKKSWSFGVRNYERLLELGFTEEEMIDFVTKKWSEMHQGEQENA